MAKKRTRVTLIESNATPAALRKQLAGQKTTTLALWVRKPDAATASRPVIRPARLCRCRAVCLAVVEDTL
jgi:hypothetical protein